MSEEIITLAVSIAPLTYQQVAKTIDHSLLRPELTEDEKQCGRRLAEAAGATFVKTSTCFALSGATLDALLDVLNASTTRIGATAIATILDEVRRCKVEYT